MATHPADTSKASPTDQAQAVLKGIVIPSCPAVLTDLRAEMAGNDPDLRKVARLVSADVALSVAVLRTVNSPYFGLSRTVESIEQAVSIAGMRQVALLVTSILMRQSVQGNGLNLVRFWDVSTKRSFAMKKLARGLKMGDADAAQSFGLFCDIGIPLLMQRFPEYGVTLKLANDAQDVPFTEVESERHGADHAQIGAMMARSWGLGDTLVMAVRRHHDYTVFHDPKVPQAVCQLIAMSLVAELAIQRFSRLNDSAEWLKGGEFAIGALMLSDLDLEDWLENLVDGLSSGV